VSSTDVLLNVATAARLFHASDGTGFADLIVDGHRESWPLRSNRFQAWLRQQYYERTWDAPSPAALNAALNVLEAQAQFDGPQLKVSVRLAEHDGLIYLDLADEFWRCVEIGANGWRIAEESPVRFRRSGGMQPLPLPVRGGSVEALAPFLNLASENDFVLVVAWLLGALRAGGPYPVLAIAGEQGSAKTVLSKLLRALIDPSVAPVRALPRDERELFIAASNGHVSSRSHARTSWARSSMRPRMGYACCRVSASSGCRAWLTSRFGPQPARAHFDRRAPSKPLIRTTGAPRLRTSSTPIQWRPLCARSWPTGGNGRVAHPTFCSSAPTGLAGPRVPPHSLAGCAGHRASSAPSGLKLPSAARGGWERGQSG